MGNVKEGGGVINVFTVEQQKERRGKEGTVGKTDYFLYSLLTNYFFCLFLLVPLVLTTNDANTALREWQCTYACMCFMVVDAYQQ